MIDYDTIELPEFLNIPSKCLPLITEFNNHTEFLLEGGRGSGKTQSVSRFLLYLCGVRQVRVMCGRETQANIEDSVYTELKDLILENDLNYDVKRDKIVHRVTGSEFKFRGFREQNRSGVKGISGVDILWIDEAQEISKATLDIVMPTVRKAKNRVIFTMNRHLHDDAVYTYCMSSSACLHIRVNYYDNPYLTESLERQARECRERSERDYKHIWLGEPLAASSDLIFSADVLKRACHLNFIDYPAVQHQRVIGIDVAAQGDDMCVATVLDRVSHMHYEVTSVEGWDYSEPSESIGRIVAMIGRLKPDVVAIDVGGMGGTMWSVIKEALGDKGDIIRPFDGASTDGIDKGMYRNKRAAAYFNLLHMFEDNLIKLSAERDRQAIHELERTRFKYLTNGKRQVFSKQELKSANNIGKSPDYADSLVMAAWATKWLGSALSSVYNGGDTVKRVHKRVLRGY